MILPLHADLRRAVTSALGELYGLAPDATPPIVIEYPPDRKMGDLAVTVAFDLARVLRKAPRLIAAEIAEAAGREDLGRLEATGAGYLNLFLDRPRFARARLGGDPPAPAPGEREKTIVEHTAINPNKAAHVGHLRNAALGDTLCRLLRFRGADVEVQNYIDDTGVQVADVVVGLRELERKDVESVRRLAAEPRFDYYCWDLYARVTQWYEEDDARLSYRRDALHDLEHDADPTAAMARAVTGSIVRCHLRTMARLGVEYDLLSWEGDILRLAFWDRAFEILKASGAVRLQADGRLAGCWVMPIDDAGEAGATQGDAGEAGATQGDAGEAGATQGDASEAGATQGDAGGGPDARLKVIVRSNGTVTYVGKDIAYQLWKFGLLGRDFHYRRFDAQPSDRLLWTTSSTVATDAAGHDAPPGGAPAAPDAAADAPPFGRAAAVYNVIDTRQSYLQRLLAQALRALDHPAEAERSVHFSYEMVALSRNTAEVLGHATPAGDGKPFVEVSGRKGLGVKGRRPARHGDDASRAGGRDPPPRPRRGRAPTHRRDHRDRGRPLLHDQVLARQGHRLRHRRGPQLRGRDRAVPAVRRRPRPQDPPEAAGAQRPRGRGHRAEPGDDARPPPRRRRRRRAVGPRPRGFTPRRGRRPGGADAGAVRPRQVRLRARPALQRLLPQQPPSSRSPTRRPASGARPASSGSRRR